MEMSAAVFRKVHEPLTIEQVEIDKPWGREVLVRTVATGVCHSDLHVVDGNGRFPLDRPFVLGHEGAGVVEAVGADVTTLRVGDHVVACLSGFCGTCPQCLSGHPNVCTGGIVARAETATPRVSQNGQPFRTFAAIGSYAEHMLLHENSLVRIDPEIPLDRAALVGCGVLTGVGAALRSAGLQAGQTVAVFGCGGVGLVHRAGRAHRRRAADHRGGHVRFQAGDGEGRRRDARGEHHAGRSGEGGARAHRRRSASITRSRRSASRPCAARRSRAWRCAAPRRSSACCRRMRRSSSPGWRSGRSARCRPRAWARTSSAPTFPNYLEFYRQGRLDLDAMISRRGHLGDINEAFRAMKAGEVARTVLMFD